MATLLEKIWASHLVARPEGRPDLLYCDRHLVHEVTSPQAFDGLRRAGRKIRRPDLTFAVVDHVVPTTEFTRPLADEIAEGQLAALEKNCEEFGLELFYSGHPNQGVIHVTMSELAIVLPGNTVFCGDSHTSTHGAFGALAFGVGTSEVEHIMATQCVTQATPKRMAVRFDGLLSKGVYSKDMALYMIRTIGHGGGTGHVIEYLGEAVRSLSMEARMTLCNLSVECGAKAGMVAPDETTISYLKGRPFAPRGEDFERAAEYWRSLPSDEGAVYHREVSFDAASIKPQVTWGTNPGQTADLDGVVPDPAEISDAEERKAAEDSMAYAGLKPGQKFSETPIDAVFIGSCTNGRIEDFRIAAKMLKGRKVANGIMALAVPGSEKVKRDAEAEGLDKVFKEAGFEWRNPGCSMCLGMNPDLLEPGQRSASTSNRNFRGRQGRDTRTHLVSPAAAAASAITGYLTDPRPHMED